MQIHLIRIRAGFGIHPITAVSVIKRSSLCEVYSLGPLSVLGRLSPYYRGFLKKKYMRILSGSHWKLSLIERCPY